MKKNNAKCNLYDDCICTTRQTEAKTDGPKVRWSPIYPCQKQRSQSVLNGCAYIFRVSVCGCRHREGNGALAMVDNFLKNDDFSFHLHLYGGSTMSAENDRKEFKEDSSYNARTRHEHTVIANAAFVCSMDFCATV